jgi:hypothetical protein
MLNFDYNDLGTQSGTLLADGIYDGAVESAEAKTSATGNKMIVVKFKRANGHTVTERLNLGHAKPEVQKIAQQKVQAIIAYGVNQPSAQFGTFEQLAAYLKAVPVKIYYKGKGLDDKGYPNYSLTFKAVEPERKITKAATAAASKSVY